MFKSLKITFKGIFFKFTLMFILVGFIPLFGMSYLLFEKLPDELTTYMVASYEESLLYASKNIALKIEEYDQLTKNIYEYGRAESRMLQDVLRGQDYRNLTSTDENYIEDYMRSLNYSDSNIESVLLLDPEQHVFDYYSKSTGYYHEDVDVSDLPDFEAIYDSKKALTILPTHSEFYFSESDHQLITFARNYLDLNYLPESEHILATLLLEVNLSFVDEIISRMELEQKGELYIVNEKGYDVYASDNNNQTAVQILDTINFDSDISGHVVTYGQYHFYQSIEGSDWLMVFSVDRSQVQQMIDNFRTITYIILVIVLIALTFVALTFSGNLSKPIRSIIDQMKNVSGGDLDTKVSVKASYEVNQLADAFNDMTEQLKLHIDRAYGAQLKQREAELNGLKTQIRPHYLYNTLEIIRMSALEESADDTREMIVSLSEQLKYMIGQYGDLVTVGDEVGMIENYFMIINKRYEGRISLSIDVPKSCYPTIMLKLLLQPLVENAVVHGLKVKKGKGKVRVSGKAANGIMTVQVMDDGVGMDEETLLGIQELLQSEHMGKEYDGTWKNIGLKNVHDRIQMYYGAEYGLSVSSKVNIGTKMTVTFPIE